MRTYGLLARHTHSSSCLLALLQQMAPTHLFLLFNLFSHAMLGCSCCGSLPRTPHAVIREAMPCFSDKTEDGLRTRPAFADIHDQALPWTRVRLCPRFSAFSMNHLSWTSYLISDFCACRARHPPCAPYSPVLRLRLKLAQTVDGLAVVPVVVCAGVIFLVIFAGLLTCLAICLNFLRDIGGRAAQLYRHICALS